MSVEPPSPAALAAAARTHGGSVSDVEGARSVSASSTAGSGIFGGLGVGIEDIDVVSVLSESLDAAQQQHQGTGGGAGESSSSGALSAALAGMRGRGPGSERGDSRGAESDGSSQGTTGIEKEARRIQSNVRAWLRRKSFLSVRRAARTMQRFVRRARTQRSRQGGVLGIGIESEGGQTGGDSSPLPRGRVDVLGSIAEVGSGVGLAQESVSGPRGRGGARPGTPSSSSTPPNSNARRQSAGSGSSPSPDRQATSAATMLQARIRGIIARRELQELRRQAAAAMVIQRNMKKWAVSEQDAGQGSAGSQSSAEDEEERLGGGASSDEDGELPPGGGMLGGASGRVVGDLRRSLSGSSSSFSMQGAGGAQGRGRDRPGEGAGAESPPMREAGSEVSSLLGTGSSPRPETGESAAKRMRVEKGS